jgi:hypothetical protein
VTTDELNYGRRRPVAPPVGAITLGAVADATHVWVSVGIAGVLLTLAGVCIPLQARGRQPRDDEPATQEFTVHHART